jgi:hypothetical protein
MSAKSTKNTNTTKKTPEKYPEQEILFTCKFCAETKPVVELVIMKQFFPPIPSCKACAKATRTAPGT